jgi:hypothetical protein
MVSLLESVTFEQRIGLVTLCSAILVSLAVFGSGLVGWPAPWIRRLRRACALAVPLVVAHVAYWLPLWTRADDLDQAHAWAFLGFGAPFLPALLVSATIVWIAERRERASMAAPVEGRGVDESA